jgi:hypothetical protein
MVAERTTDRYAALRDDAYPAEAERLHRTSDTRANGAGSIRWLEKSGQAAQSAPGA